MKRLVAVLLLFTVTLLLSSCMSHIEDTNGDDTSLESIDLQAEVEAKSYSSTASMTSSVSSGGSTFCFSHDDIDANHLELSYGKVSGVTKIHCSDVSEGVELVLTITSSVTSGNLEIVIVGPDDTVVEVIEVDTIVTVKINPTEDGEYFVVIGAESAEVSIEIDRDIN